MKLLIYQFLFLLICSFNSIKGQDSLSLFNKNIEQYHTERELKSNFHKNPASMNHYSNSSFSDFGIHYQWENKNNYREVLGAGNQGLIIQTQSYKKLKNKASIWGKASYKNLTIKQQKWNENLDFHRVSPYVIADSVGGNLNYEQYAFSGGYAKKINRWNIGLEGDYTAQMGYRTRDPRTKNITSDLSITAGVDYNVYKNLSIGTFAKFNKYTQNSTLNFVSEISEPRVYQMVGLGQIQYFLSHKNAVFEEMNLQLGGQIADHQGKKWYLLGHYIHSSNQKNIGTTNGTLYPSNQLVHKTLMVELAKFFTTNQHRWGGWVNYHQFKRKGIEYGYTSNSSDIEKIFEREAYQKNYSSVIFKGFYQFQKSRFQVTATPFYSINTETEERFYPITGQQFKSLTTGINLDFKQKINDKQVFTLKSFFSHQQNTSSNNWLQFTENNAINQWLKEEYQFLKSHKTQLGLSIRYDIKLNYSPALFIEAQYTAHKISNKNNHLALLSTGITF